MDALQQHKLFINPFIYDCLLPVYRCMHQAKKIGSHLSFKKIK